MLRAQRQQIFQSVRPNRSHGMTWWIWQWSKAMSQWGWAQVRYIARSARRWARLATRCSRPTASASPSAPNTIGMMAASQHNRRIVSTGSGMPFEVSQIDEAWSPSASVGRSTCTHTSGTRRSPLLAGVAPTTSTRAITVSFSRGTSPLPSRCLTRVELGVDRGPQLGSGFGIDLGVEVPHPGDLVDPPPHRRVRLLTVELADAAVTGEQPARSWQSFRTRRSCRREAAASRSASSVANSERAASSRSRVALASASTWPAQTVPSASASSNDGSWSHTAARSAAALASLRERRPQRPRTSAGEASTPGVASDATRRATATSMASTHPRTRALNSTMWPVRCGRTRRGRAPTALRRLSESPSRTYLYRTYVRLECQARKIGEILEDSELTAGTRRASGCVRLRVWMTSSA